MIGSGARAAGRGESRPGDLAIWGYAFGYFACYAPYTALTKAMSKGALAPGEVPPTGFELLPITVMASVVGMMLFITLMGWWQYAPRVRFAGLSIPRPGRRTFISGLCTAGIIATTTMSYTFSGVSIVFVMLLMRGGMLLLAPIVDSIAGRRVRWFSWVALGLTLGALVVAFAEGAGWGITLVCAVDIALYLAFYFFRLNYMSRLAKSDDPKANVRFFVEEQLVASPALLIALAIGALIGEGQVLHDLREGFTSFWGREVLWHGLLIGFLSQGTGVFGGLILLDRRENSYCVPVNRASSILAGVVATYGLMLVYDMRGPSGYELVGAAMIVVAIMFLTIAPMREAQLRRRAAAAAAASAAPAA
jgi:hypothetical protein